MRQYYYIKIRRFDECMYDGYFMIKDDNKIVGYAHDSILVGSEFRIIELTKDGMYEYPLAQEYYLNMLHFDTGYFTCGENLMQISLQATKRINKKRIQEAVEELLKDYPKSIQKSFKENFA